MNISIIQGSLTGSFLFQQDYHKDVSLFFFERPVIFQQWFLSKPYCDILKYKDFTISDTHCDKINKTVYSRRVRSQSGKLIYQQRDKNKSGNHLMSVAALSTNISINTPSIEDWDSRYKRQITTLKKRWGLEDNLSSDPYKSSPYIAVGYLEHPVYRESQQSVLENVFKNDNVHVILYEDSDYLDSVDIEYPVFDKGGKYTNKSSFSDTSKFGMQQHLMGRFTSRYKRKITQSSSESDIDVITNRCLQDLTSELFIWNEYGDQSKKFSDQEKENIIESVQDTMKEWSYMYKKVLSGEWSRKKVSNWRYVRSKIRKEALADKIENERKEFQDESEIPAFENEFYKLDTKGLSVGYRGFCRRKTEKELEDYSDDERRELEESRMVMRERRHNNRDAFKDYHKSYNALKHEITGTWEKRKSRLGSEQNKRWREFRSRMKALEKKAGKKSRQDVKQRHINFDKFTLEDMTGVDNSDVVRYYTENFLWNGRDNLTERRCSLPF